jgi:hypothetical protein
MPRRAARTTSGGGQGDLFKGWALLLTTHPLSKGVFLSCTQWQQHCWQQATSLVFFYMSTAAVIYFLIIRQTYSLVTLFLFICLFQASLFCLLQQLSLQPAAVSLSRRRSAADCKYLNPTRYTRYSYATTEEVGSCSVYKCSYVAY